MGKSTRKRQKKSTKAKKGGKSSSNEEWKTTIALVDSLGDAGDSEARIHALVTLGGIFDDQQNEDVEESDRVRLAELDVDRRIKVLNILNQRHGFRLLVDRITDVDEMVRFHACNTLCMMAASSNHLVSDKFVENGIHIGALALIRDLKTKKQAEGTIPRAIHLLCELCSKNGTVVGALEDDMVLCNICEGMESGNKEMRECCARLIHIALDDNAHLAKKLVNVPFALKALETVCTSPSILKEDPTSVLHALAGFSSLARFAERADLASPEKVCERQMEVCDLVLNSESSDVVDETTKCLALETLTNSCSIDDDEEEANEQVETFRSQATRQFADRFAKGKISTTVANVIPRMEAILVENPSDYSTIVDIGARTCGFLDNLVQNASNEATEQHVGLTNTWQAIYRLTGLVFQIAAIGIQQAQELENNDNAPLADLEELLIGLTSLLWSIARRAQAAHPEVTLKIPVQHVEAILTSWLPSDITDAVRANFVGILGTFGCFPQPLALSDDNNEEFLTKITNALLHCAKDPSLLVVSQAVDSLIDLYSDDDRDPLFRKLGVNKHLKQILPRVTSTLVGTQDSNTRSHVDHATLAEARENLVEFIKYKS